MVCSSDGEFCSGVAAGVSGPTGCTWIAACFKSMCAVPLSAGLAVSRLIVTIADLDELICPQDFGVAARKAAFVATTAGAVTKRSNFDCSEKGQKKGEAATSRAGAIEVYCHPLVLAQRRIATTNQLARRHVATWAQRSPRSNMRMYILGTSLVPSDGSQARLRSTARLPLAGGTAMNRSIGGPASICCPERLLVIQSRSRTLRLDCGEGLGPNASVTVLVVCFPNFMLVVG
jgi:hypothetical protein